MKTIALVMIISTALSAQQLPDAPTPKPRQVTHSAFGSPKWVEHHKRLSIPVGIGLAAFIAWELRSGSRHPRPIHLIAVPCPSDACIVRK